MSQSLCLFNPCKVELTSVIFDAAVVSIESRDDYDWGHGNIETCDGDMVSAPGSLPSNGHKPTMLENYFMLHILQCRSSG